MFAIVAGLFSMPPRLKLMHCCKIDKKTVSRIKKNSGECEIFWLEEFSKEAKRRKLEKNQNSNSFPKKTL